MKGSELHRSIEPLSDRVDIWRAIISFTVHQNRHSSRGHTVLVILCLPSSNPGSVLILSDSVQFPEWWLLVRITQAPYWVLVVSASGSVEGGRSLFFLHSLLQTTAMGGYCAPLQLGAWGPCDQLLFQVFSSHGAPEALLSPPASSGLCGPSLSPKTTYTSGSLFNVFKHLEL